MVVGTLDYIAPERIQDGGGDGRSDVYALGCVLYEALTGGVPFPRDSDVPKMYAHLSEPPPVARDTRPGTPDRLSEIALRAMAKNPDDRFATADEMAAALTSEARSGPAPRRLRRLSRPPSPPRRRRCPPRRRRSPPGSRRSRPIRRRPADPRPGPPAPEPPRRRVWPFVAGAGAILAAVLAGVLLLSGGR